MKNEERVEKVKKRETGKSKSERKEEREGVRARGKEERTE